MLSLQNEFLRLDLDARARMTHLENLKTGKGNIIAQPKPIYRLNLHTPPNYEDVAFAEDQHCCVTKEGEALFVRLNEVKARSGIFPVRLEMKITLDGDHACFDAQVENLGTSTISELYYPLVGAIKTLDGGPMDLLWPNQVGERKMNIEAMLMEMKNREALHEISATYPGPLSMCWTALEGGRQCLYFASYDALLHVATLRAKGSAQGGVSLELNKMCFVKPGESWHAPRAVVRLYEGSWREGADEYAAFAKTWRKPVEPQEWMKRMNGYFLVINKQQYGDEIWPYDTLPELYEHAKAHGFDTLGLFGWYHTGHDNNYPDLEVSPTMGGREGLEKGIAEVHRQGGHVTLYYQGHLMDVNSKFYQEKGKELEGRTVYNNPYYEFYPKACSSDFARSFSRRVFSTVCPSCPEWHELMAQRIDWVASFGADGALYDQIGGMPPYPCFNDAHPHVHGKPSLSYTQGRIRLHTRIQQQVKKHKDFAFMSEHVTDAYSQFLDCIHGIGSVPSRREGGMVSGPGMRGRGGNVRERMMPELFRYTFPEAMCTVRNPNPYMDERLVNYAFVFGFKFEMELRYLTDQRDIRADVEAQKRIYAKAVADLRREFEDYLLLGTFRADEDVESHDPALIATQFRAPDGRRAIALWNDTDQSRLVKIDIKGMRPLHYATVRARGEGMPARLGPNEIAIVEMAEE